MSSEEIVNTYYGETSGLSDHGCSDKDCRSPYEHEQGLNGEFDFEDEDHDDLHLEDEDYNEDDDED